LVKYLISENVKTIQNKEITTPDPRPKSEKRIALIAYKSKIYEFSNDIARNFPVRNRGMVNPLAAQRLHGDPINAHHRRYRIGGTAACPHFRSD
jgi:hypothetical protein